MRPSGGNIMRVETYLMTIDPMCAGQMLELENIRKSLNIAGCGRQTKFGLHLRGRGPRKEAGLKDGKNYTSYLPLRHATRIDVYVRARGRDS